LVRSSSHEDHNHDDSRAGPRDNLYQYIDRPNVVALNTSGDISKVIKPWHRRLVENEFIRSDVDDQLILHIPFTGSVKLRALLLRTGPTDRTPTKVALFANEGCLDFEDDKIPTQEFDIPQSVEVGEYTGCQVFYAFFYCPILPGVVRRGKYSALLCRFFWSMERAEKYSSYHGLRGTSKFGRS